jgi:hypothetical protein
LQLGGDLGVRIARSFAFIAALAVSSCGGGGGGSSSPSPPSPPPPPPPPAPSVSVVSSSLVAVSRESASEAIFTLDLLQTGAATPIVPDVLYDTSLLSLQGPVVLDGSGHYKLTFKSRNDLALGGYAGAIQFRLCQQAACTSVYPNTTLSLAFNLSVVLNDWATFQRDAAHTGYVHLTVDTAHITSAWSVYSDELVGFTRAAADADHVYFGVWGFQDVTRYSGLVGLDLKTGEPLWSELLDVGGDGVGDPATAGGKVFIPYEKSGACCVNPISIHQGSDGGKLGSADFVAQGGAFLAPTPIDNDLISTSGQYGNVVYDHSQTDGAKKWEALGSGYDAWHLEATAADHDNIYHYTGESLDVFRRSDGLRIRSIPDPGHVMNAYDYWGGPIILQDGTVLAYSGTVSAERADVRFGAQRPLVRYRPNTGDIAWRTVNSYRNIPATHGNLIFAARNNPYQLDAINIGDGSIAWSWTPPDGTGFRANIVVTDNVLFLSTSKNVYGISLSDRSVVFTYNAPGDIEITPYNLLLISELMEYSNADAQTPLRGAPRLEAFHLR